MKLEALTQGTQAQMAFRNQDSVSSSSDSEQICWICLDAGPGLVKPCNCPRQAHPKCLARWQLQSAGRDEEHHCRFCQQTLPDWKPILTPSGLQPSTPVVSVHYNGVCYRLRVKPGPEGFEHFRRQLHKITGMPMLECMQITFQCKSPDTAQELSFKGISAFDAAIHCAAVSAAERLTHAVPRQSVDCTQGSTTAASSRPPAATGSPAPAPAAVAVASTASALPAVLPSAVVRSSSRAEQLGATVALPAIPSPPTIAATARPQAVSAPGAAPAGSTPTLPPIRSLSTQALQMQQLVALMPRPPSATRASSIDASDLPSVALSGRTQSATRGAGQALRRVDSQLLIDHDPDQLLAEDQDGDNGEAHLTARGAGMGSQGAKGGRGVGKVRDFLRRIFATPA